MKFRCKDTKKIHGGDPSRKWGPDVIKAARVRLNYLEDATSLEDLKKPPGNRLKPLDKDRKGQHSIRINDQWRICFVWTDQGAVNVEVVDYH